MKRIPILVVVLGILLSVAAVRAPRGERGPAPVTVFVVRHAEKAEGAGDDPSLSETGTLRAQALARTLRDLPIAAIRTTRYRRTRETAAALSARTGIEAKVYDPRKQGDLADELRALAPGSVALVVGHSNTVPALVELLGGSDAPQLGERDHDDLFCVTLEKDRPTRVLRLHYGPAD